jgi:ATP-dependent DNA helicase RecG
MKISLDILLQSGEGQFTEFKSALDRPGGGKPVPRSRRSIARDIAITLAEFANADGGTLLVGVENDGAITGIPHDERQILAIRETASQMWKRVVPYSFTTIDRSGLAIIAFEVGPQPEVFMLTDGRTPYRNNDQTMWLSAEDVIALKQAKTSTLVERSIVQSATLNDLDAELIQRFRNGVGAGSSVSDEDLFVQHDLAVRDGNQLKFTLAACLLFGKPPMARFHERSGANFRRFNGIEALVGTLNNEEIDRTYEFPLPILIDQVFDLLRDQIKTSNRLSGLFFEERPEYPTFAWQEAVVNAVAHRNYAYRGNEIEIRMFDDRMEISSPGLPPEPVTITELQQRLSVHSSRNPRIMRTLRAFRYVRERGEGLPRMFSEMEESSLPLPEITAVGSSFQVTLRNTPIFDEATMSWLRTFPLGKLNPSQRRILAHTFQTGRRSFVLQDYANINQIDKEQAKREIRMMVEDGMVEMVGIRKAARYYPRLQSGSNEELLRDHFTRHDTLTNSSYRLLAKVDGRAASRELKRLEQEGLLIREGERKGTRYKPTELLMAKARRS